MAAKVKLADVAAPAGGGAGETKTWAETGLEALPGWVLFKAVDDGPKRTPGGIEIVSLNKEMRPMLVEVVAAGPTGVKADGKPDGYFVPGLKPGTRVLVPEYGVKIHEDPVRGDLRCYEYRQLLALVVADEQPT